MVGSQSSSSQDTCSLESAERTSTDVCWVCLEEGSAQRPLAQPCSCPRQCHPTCLARWQLHCAGTSEETHCRFCRAGLPDWRAVLTPSAGPSRPPIMNVAFNGKVHRVVVRDGPEGYAAFTREVRRIFGIADGLEMNMTFDCSEPATGGPLVLNGAGAFNAAVHCASVAASRRLASCCSQKPGSSHPLSHLQLQDATPACVPPGVDLAGCSPQ